MADAEDDALPPAERWAPSPDRLKPGLQTPAAGQVEPGLRPNDAMAREETHSADTLKREQQTKATGIDFPTAEALSGWLPKYEVQERLEVGADSAIYVGRQLGLDRQVMIRIMPEPAPELVPLLIDRLRKRARLVHPKIAAVFDFGRTPGGPLYLATEHVDGARLDALIQTREVTKNRAYQLAIDVCEAVQVVHDQQLTAGALSARTVFVTRDWQLKLSGVGMAETAAGELSWQDAPAGSVAGDIHALGAVIHEMFARSAPEPNGRVSRNLPPEVARVLMRCLQSDPAKRYQRPEDVRTALVEALRSEKKRTVAAAVQPPESRAAAPATPRSPAGRPPVVQHGPPSRPVADFMRWLDRTFWASVRTALHLSIITGTIVLVVVMFLMKGRIIIETGESAEPEPAAPGFTMPSPPPVQQPLGLGPLPPAPLLKVPGASSAPMALTAPAAPDSRAELDAQYLNAVQREITAALEASRLDDMPHLRRELERLQSGTPMPAQDEDDLPVRLKQLREVYRRELAKIMEESAKTPG